MSRITMIMTNSNSFQEWHSRDTRRNDGEGPCFLGAAQEISRQAVCRSELCAQIIAEGIPLIVSAARNWPIVTHFLTLPDRVRFNFLVIYVNNC